MRQTRKITEQESLWQAETIVEKLQAARGITGLELVVLDALGGLQGTTRDFPDAQLSRLRNNRQALLQNDWKMFGELSLWPLQRSKMQLGWLAVACPQKELTAQAEQMLEELAQQMAFLLWHKWEMQEIEKKHREQFLYDLLYNNFNSSEEVIQLGRLWNMQLEKPHHVVVVEFDRPLPGDKHDRLLAELDNEWMRVLSARFVQPVLLLLRMQLVILFEDDRETPRSQQELAKIMKAAMTRVKADFPSIPPFSVGIGRVRYRVEELCRSFQEARQALSLGRFCQPENGITCYDDLGVLKLLSHIRTEELDDFAQEALGPLMDYDNENGTELLKTLEIYFQENESLPQAADRLFIHANTLRNRLKKIESLLDVELNQADVRVRFYVASQALRIVRHSL